MEQEKKMNAPEAFAHTKESTSPMPSQLGKSVQPVEIVVRIPFFQLVLSSSNPRKRLNPQADQELIKSIKENRRKGGPGVLEPLLCRPYHSDADRSGIKRYEVIVGSRRFRCSKSAGLNDVPCIVRLMTDQEAGEIQIIEKLQRLDVGEVEKARSLKDLVAAGASVEMIAKKIGKSASYVYQQLKLCELIPEAQKRMEDGVLPAAHAILIARLPESVQKTALQELFPEWAKDAVPPKMSVYQLAEYLADHAMQLLIDPVIKKIVKKGEKAVAAKNRKSRKQRSTTYASLSSSN